MAQQWADLNAIRGLTASGRAGGFRLQFPRGRAGWSVSRDCGLLVPDARVRALRVLAWARPGRPEPKKHTLVLYAGTGARSEAGAPDWREDTERSGLGALEAAGLGALAGRGESRRCFVEFSPVVVNAFAFRLDRGTAVAAATDAGLGAGELERIAGDLREEFAEVRFAFALATGKPGSGRRCAGSSPFESLRALVLSTAAAAIGSLEEPGKGGQAS
ncbi:hypothetical protein MAF45_07415 [Mesosutterella sp. OilRF-GAM-744-9]|uniref:Uncharacterized protein n=1 Tax=Mesosutterella porci TaxID=2915351 RepID=A0ABS9MSA6_9BURK|nr:hypothetical protein [Mesosutterella sp. oilRF-744-WT-GAM-9]MCG5031267.1 hypothetical protein [Mesosutterella sp. oilRF-744-WT-GAM-9]